MKYAIMADIHSNLEALQTVLSDIEKQKCTNIVCLGDVVGYNANPKECLNIIRGMEIPCVKGNHDEYCSNDQPLDGFTSKARKVIDWTRKQLTSDDREWLSELEFVRLIGGFTIVHASLNAPWNWGYVFEGQAAAASFAHQDTPLCFFGHTHVPVAFVLNKSIRGGTYYKFPVEPGFHYFIGVGSVGQPRDGDARAAYVLYDMDGDSIELRRVDYDVAAAQKKRLVAGLELYLHPESVCLSAILRG
jgi:predicted phosphodiesterase